MSCKRWILITGLAMLIAPFASAHEIRPAYLEIEQNASQTVHVLWKQPVVGDVALPLQPILSSGWLDPNTATSFYADSYLIHRWQLDQPSQSLQSQTLTIAGLEGSLTDVLLRLVTADGDETLHIIKPESATLQLAAASKQTLPATHYLMLGVGHIWTGIDHLLFVLGLVLLSALFVDLLKTITAFTVAHSITLAAAALEWVSVPSATVEAVIALSIVYLAVELVQLRRGRSGFARRFPWMVALAFGLLHGFGFAGALSEVGLPDDNIPIALFFFNVGIEIGQIAFVVGVLMALAFLFRILPRVNTLVRIAIPHAIGSLAAFWFIERTLTAFS